MATSYIQSSNASLNYLNIIETVTAKSGHAFPPKIRAAAKKKYQEAVEDLSGNSILFESSVCVAFVRDQKEPVVATRQGTQIHFYYSLEWIRKNTDYPTLLNNFIYLFEYVDLHGRFNLHSKQSEMGTLEQVIGIKTKATYSMGAAFDVKRNAALIQMKAYGEVLKSLDISIEKVIEWYYNEQVVNEFNLPSFKISLPSSETSYLEKCRTICPEIENILKRFSLLVREGEINEEVLQYESSEKVSQVPSFRKGKYAYGDGEKYLRAKHYLCSDQCMLTYGKENDESYPNFAVRIAKRKVHKSDIERYLIDELVWLTENSFIRIAEDGLIELTLRAAVIFDLWEVGFVALEYQDDERLDVIDGLIKDGFMYTGSSLFSKQESDYLSYILNDELFDNALALRNKYSHGSSVLNNNDEVNYCLLLIVLSLITIKINDELCLHKGLNSTPEFVST